MNSSTSIYAAALLAVGLFGSVSITWLFPLVAILFRKNKTQSPPLKEPSSLGEQLESLEILIPAHNEESSISGTLGAVRAAIAKASETSKLKTLVRVGADACNDRTAEIARSSGAEVVEFQFREKWKTLSALVANASCDWVALVDADVHWEPDLLACLLALKINRSNLLGVAPAFGNSGHWKLEAHLKSLENYAGGPLSVHGATVFYDRVALQKAFASLSDQSWLNDDVAVPFYLRSRFPDHSLFYWVPPRILLQERDRQGENSISFGSEWKRRTRMIRGNLQIISRIFPSAMQNNRLVALLFLRRVFRVFWIYWIAAITLATCMILSNPTIFVTAGLCLVFLASLLKPRSAVSLICSGLSSFLAPLSLVQEWRGSNEIRWR